MCGFYGSCWVLDWYIVLLALDYLIPHLHVGSDQAEGPKSKFDDDLGCGTGVRGEERFL